MPRVFPDLSNASELVDIAASGAERARGALATLLERDMVVTSSHAALVDEPSRAIVEQIESSGSEWGATVGRLGISGPPDGAAWVAFPAMCVQQLLENFRMESPGVDDEAARSMVAEVANIVTGSYLTELGDTWGVELDPTPADLDAGIMQVHADLERTTATSQSSALALGCGFTSEDGAGWDLSVYLLLSTAHPESISH